jgi:hypothetical protein
MSDDAPVIEDEVIPPTGESGPSEPTEASEEKPELFAGDTNAPTGLPRKKEPHPDDPLHKQIPIPMAGDPDFTMSRMEVKGLVKAMESKDF